MQLSRRDFVRTATIAGMGVAIFGVAGCAPKGGDAGISFKPGTYAAEANGKFAPIKIEATFSESAITEVKVIEHEESPFLSDRALEDIPAMIVENQTLELDAITGATLTSFAILSATGDCVKQAGGNPKKLSDYKKPALSTEVVDIEADLVIAGCGASGMACAIAAAQNGAKKVVVVETNSNFGGNGLVSGGFVEYIDAPEGLRTPNNADFEKTLAENLVAAEGLVPPETIEKIKEDVAAWKAAGGKYCFDSLELQAVQYTLAGEGSYPGNVSYCSNVRTFSTWITEQGFGFKKLCSIVGYPWPRWTSPVNGNLGQGYFMFYSDLMEKKNLPIEIYLCTSATELITEGKGVVGLKAKNVDGTTYNITGTSGTVLATGGFSGNGDMLREYNTMWPFKESASIPTTNVNGHNGDGIRMAQALDAQTSLMDDMMPYPMADIKNSCDETTIGDDMDCAIVNKEGQRFMDEIQDRYTLTAGIMEQTDQIMYMITDAETSMVQGDVSRYGRNLQNLINQGQLYVADTIEELGEMIGCGGATLKKTVDRYNEFALAGKDDDFGRTFFTEISPILDAPFYASPRTWAMHITVGGLVVDEQFRVINENNEVIEGLYSIGENSVGSSGIGTQGEGFALANILFK